MYVDLSADAPEAEVAQVNAELAAQERQEDEAQRAAAVAAKRKVLEEDLVRTMQGEGEGEGRRGVGGGLSVCGCGDTTQQQGWIGQASSASSSAVNQHQHRRFGSVQGCQGTGVPCARRGGLMGEGRDTDSQRAPARQGLL